MDKLGNYIHFHRENYKNYGTSYKSETEISASYFTKHKSSLRDKIDKKSSSLTNDDKEKFETVFSSIMQGKQMEGARNFDYQNLNNKIIDSFVKRVKGVTDKGQITSYGAISSEESSNLYSLAKKIGGYKKYLGEQIDTTQKTQSLQLLYNRYEKIINEDFIKALNNTSDNTVKQLILDLYNSAAATEIKNLSDLCNEPNLKELCSDALKAIGDKGTKNIKIDKSDPALDALYKVYNYFKMPASSLAQGNLAEEIGYLANEIINYNCYYETEELFNNLVAGIINRPGSKDSPTITIDSKFINKELSKELKKLPDFDLINKNGDIKLTFGQQKIDINVSSPSVGSLEGVSVKSYRLENTNWVHLDSKRPLLVHLINEGIDFTNHYLNAQAARGVEAGSLSKHTDDDILKTDALVKESNEALRLSIIQTAFKGTSFGGQHKQASLFLMNDASSGRVKLFDMNELIKDLIDVPGAFSIKIGTAGKETKLNKNETSDPTISDKSIKFYEYVKKYSNEHFEGEWKENNIGAQKRIANIIADMHKAKITTAVNARMISSRMNK